MKAQGPPTPQAPQAPTPHRQEARDRSPHPDRGLLTRWDALLADNRAAQGPTARLREAPTWEKLRRRPPPDEISGRQETTAILGICPHMLQGLSNKSSSAHSPKPSPEQTEDATLTMV